LPQKAVARAEWSLGPSACVVFFADYSGFDSALLRNLDAKWHFPEENAALLDLQMSTRESKPL